MKNLMIAGALLGLAAAACDDPPVDPFALREEPMHSAAEEPPASAPASAPTMSVVPRENSLGDALLPGMVGYMVGSSLAAPRSPAPAPVAPPANVTPVPPLHAPHGAPVLPAAPRALAPPPLGPHPPPAGHTAPNSASAREAPAAKPEPAFPAPQQRPIYLPQRRVDGPPASRTRSPGFSSRPSGSGGYRGGGGGSRGGGRR